MLRSVSLSIVGKMVLLLAGLALAQLLPGSQPAVAAARTVIFYQGQLQAGHLPANGRYDFVFRAFDAPAGGNQVGPSLPVPNLPVSDGLFEAPLAFSFSPGKALYVEVSVRPAGDDVYTVLTPRQQLPAAAIPAAAPTVPRSRSISPAGFIRDLTAPELTMTSDIGLRWQANTSEEAGFYMARPADWDGQSPVTVKITFALGGSTAGATNWRLKLNTYSPGSGEWLTNPATHNADAVLIFPAGPSWYRIYSQTFTLDAPAFHNEPLWSFFFLRGNAGNAETFTGDLYVLGAEVEYQAVP